MIEKKRGGAKYSLILWLIVGIIVLGIVLYFLFNEYFTEDELNLESCRRSVLVRASSPDIRGGESLGRVGIVNLKEKFPLKCKTQVIEIGCDGECDEEDLLEAEKEIGETIATCWYLFGRGESALFASGEYDSFCVPCARISFAEETKKFYRENEINMNDVLDMQLRLSGQTVRQYLGIALISAVPGRTANLPLLITSIHLYSTEKSVARMVIEGDTFGMSSEDVTSIEGAVKGFFSGTKPGGVYLPEKISPDKGDLLVWFDQMVGNGGLYDSSIFWFQSGQNNPDPYGEVAKAFGKVAGYTASLCDYYDGIPA